MPALSSLLGPVLVALGLAALLVVVIRSNLKSRTGDHADLDDLDGLETSGLGLVDEDGWPLDLPEPELEESDRTPAYVVAPAAPAAPVAAAAVTQTDHATIAALEAELHALRAEVGTLTEALASGGRRGRRLRRSAAPAVAPAAASPGPEAAFVADEQPGDADVAPDLEDSDDLELVLPSLTLPVDVIAPAGGLTIAGAAWVVPTTVEPLAEQPAEEPAAVQPALQDPEPVFVTPTTPEPVTLSFDATPARPSEPAPAAPVAAAAPTAASDGWDALQLVAPATGATPGWTAPATAGAGGTPAEPELRLEPAVPDARPDLAVPLAAGAGQLDHLAQLEPGGSHPAAYRPTPQPVEPAPEPVLGTAAQPAITVTWDLVPESPELSDTAGDAFPERAVETTARRPVAPVATAGYSEMSRELAAAGRLRDAVLAQWAADLRVLAPLLGDRVPRLSRSLQSISSSDPATMLGSARAVAVMLADQALLGEVIPALDDLDHLSRRLVLAAHHGTTVRPPDPQLPQDELAALESVLVRSAEAGGDGGHVSVSLRWDLITHLASGVDPRVVRSLLREALEPHEREAFDSELMVAAR